jgi:hypothetical protein
MHITNILITDVTSQNDEVIWPRKGTGVTSQNDEVIWPRKGTCDMLYNETYSARFHFEVEALSVQVPEEGVPFPDFFFFL